MVFKKKNISNLFRKKKNKKIQKCRVIDIFILSAFIFLIIPSFFVNSAIASEPDSPHVAIAVIAENNNDFLVGMQLDNRISFVLYDSSNISLLAQDLGDFNATFICDFNVLNAHPSLLQYIKSNVSQGMGLFIQTNKISESYNLTNLEQIEPILPFDILTEINGTPLEITPDQFGNIAIHVNESIAENSILMQKIGFSSMPQVLYASKTIPHANTSVLIYSDSKEPILTESAYGNGRIIGLTAPVKNDTNNHLADWPYFNYMVYYFSFYLSNVQDSLIDDYRDWPYSPLPDSRLKTIVLIFIIIIIAITLLGFYYMKKRSKRIPLVIKPPTITDILAARNANIELNVATVATEDLKEGEVNQAISKEKDNNNLPEINHKKGDKYFLKERRRKKKKKNQKKKKVEKEIGWAEIGYHKPLAGFSIMFYLSIALLLPLVIIIMYILPNFVLTDPSQLGISFIMGNIFSAVFIAGDFGLAQAFDKFVSENYIRDPAKALKYVQFFVWFQMLSGLVQVAAIAFIGLYVIPKSAAMAFMSFQFVAKAFVQWPGIGYLFTHSMKALQRTDKEQIVSLISVILFDVGGMAVFTSLFLEIGRKNPVIGIVIGGSLGITMAEVFKTFGLLVVSGIVFAKMDKRFSIWDMFRVDFDKTLVKQTLWFGLKSMASNVILLFGNFFVTIYIMLNMQSYTTYSAYIGSATFLLYPITFMLILYENALPTTAEAYGNECYNLTQSYISFGWKYFFTFGTLVFTSFVFFLNPFLTEILPPLYKPMGFFLGWYSLTRITMTLGDFSRLFLVAIDKLSQYIVFITIEQIIRFILLITLLDILPKPEYILIFGELPGAILKTSLTWIYTNKKVIRVKIYIWQTLIAPILAAVAYVIIGYIFMTFYRNLLLTMEPLLPTIIFSFIIFTALSMTVYPFVLALVGGWDDETFRQLKFAAEKSGPSKLFAVIFLKMTELGNRISPLYNKFPIDYSKAKADIQKLINLKFQSNK
ncbi:MAG: hypothetical protein ACTSRZ_06065 [Promethearchaeota archaeon]